LAVRMSEMGEGTEVNCSDLQQPVVTLTTVCRTTSNGIMNTDACVKQ